MELSLETPDGQEVKVERQELPADVAEGKQAFLRAQANDPVKDEKTRTPRRRTREVTVEDDKSPARVKADKARVKKDKPKLEPKDFTESLSGTVSVAWLGTGAIPIAPSQAVSVILGANKEAIVGVVNAAAQTNHEARKFAEWCSSGGASNGVWMLGMVQLGITVVQQTKLLMSDPEIFKAATETNKANIAEYMNALMAQTGMVPGTEES